MSTSIKKTSLYIDEKKLNSLKIVAINKGLKVNEIINFLIDKYLEEVETE